MRLPFALALALTTATATAQPTWRAHPAGSSVSLDVLKSIGEGVILVGSNSGEPFQEASPSVFQSAQILSARVPVGGRLVVVGEAPFAFADYSVPEGVEDPFGRGYSDFGVGNPYVGAEVAVSRDLVVEGGVRLPLASESPSVVIGSFFPGYVADFERPEAFLPDKASVVLGVRVERPVTSVVSVLLQLAPTLSFDTSDPFPNRTPPGTTVVARYGVQSVVRAGPVRLHGGLIGREFVVDGGVPIGNTASVVLGAVAGGLAVQPGALVRVPVRGDFGRDAVVGLSLTVRVR